MAFSNAFVDISARTRLRPEPTDGDDVQRAVGGAVVTAVQSGPVFFSPEEAGIGLTPHKAAKLASDCRRWGLSPAVIN